MRKAFVLAGVLMIGAALAVVPLPLYVIGPGSAFEVPERVDVDHPKDDPSGRLLFLTVRLSRPSTIGALAAWLDDSETVIRRERVVPEGVDDAEYFRAQRRLFAESTALAAAVGLRRAGFDVTISGAGAQVAAVLPGSPADGRLREGDLVVAAAGTPVRVASDLVAATARADAGELTLRIRRGDERMAVDIALEEVTELGRPGLGVAVRTLDREIVLPFDVDIDEGRIGGPSAGMMVALTVYDLVESGDLTRGRVVAGTGTIDGSGTVGPVGGVHQKVAAAIDAGADLFLSPESEAAAARAAAGDDLRVIPVTSLDEAIAALEQP